MQNKTKTNELMSLLFLTNFYIVNYFCSNPNCLKWIHEKRKGNEQKIAQNKTNTYAREMEREKSINENQIGFRDEEIVKKKDGNVWSERVVKQIA